MNTQDDKKPLMNLINGTNIPADPRKRTKNHARLEITVWAEIDDETLQHGGFRDATDAMRQLEAGFKGEAQNALSYMEQIPIVGSAKFHLETRVSK